jgi:hypothetical protein
VRRLNDTFMFPYDLDAVFEQIFFRKKLRVLLLVGPRAVEIAILPTSPSQKRQKQNIKYYYPKNIIKWYLLWARMGSVRIVIRIKPLSHFGFLIRPAKKFRIRTDPGPQHCQHV